MSLFYRIGYYLVGFSVGLIFLAFVFNGKKTSCNYSPSSRVKSSLLQKKIPCDCLDELRGIMHAEGMTST